MSARARYNVRLLDDEMRKLWDLGRNVFLLWCRRPRGIAVLRMPHENLIRFLAGFGGTRAPARAAASGEAYLAELMSQRRAVTPGELRTAATLLGGDVCELAVPYPQALRQGDAQAIESLVQRYGMNFHTGRAVVLLDIVDFSLYHPLEQVTQIHSLSTALNWAHSALLHRRIDVRFARSSTGDGFYIWNRDTGPRANLHLYHLMHLMLANNALRRRSAPAGSVPEVKTAFHIGSYYDIYLAEGLRPASESVIVGNVTVELARILGSASPGQILVGDFTVADPAGAGDLDSAAFIDRLQETLTELQGIELLDNRLASLRCYLTGEKREDGSFGITRYRVTDKHRRSRDVYNAKVNITPEAGEPIYLGLQNHEVALPAVTDERVGELAD